MKLDAQDLEGHKSIDAGQYEKRYNCILKCEDDQSFHLYVNFTKGVFHCFKCESKGKLIQREATNLSAFEQTVRQYKNRSIDNFLDQSYEDCQRIVKTLPRSEKINLKRRLPEDHKFKMYLFNRGLSSALMDKLDVHYSTDTTGIYKDTVIFPVYNRRSPGLDLEYFVARRISDTYPAPKYVNAPWPKGSSTYEIWNGFKASKWNCTAICEGLFDAIALHKEGILEVHALLGKKATTAQLEKIASNSGAPILIFLDYDAFVYAAQLKMALSTISNRRSQVVMLPGGDPDKLHQEDKLTEIIESCEFSSPA